MADGVCLGRQIPSPHLLWTVTGGAPPAYLLTLTPPSQALTYLPSQQTTYLPKYLPIPLASYLPTQSDHQPYSSPAQQSLSQDLFLLEPLNTHKVSLIFGFRLKTIGNAQSYNESSI